MKDDKKCILIVDDETRIVRALKDYLQINGFYILTAYDGYQALQTFSDNSKIIDLILLDVMMPGKNGFEVLEEIRKTSFVPAMMLTAKGAEYDQVEGFDCGADDYIVKPFSTTILIARIEAIFKRTHKGEKNDLICGELVLNVVKRTAHLHNTEIELTRREFDLLYYFLINQSVTLSREQILNGVWGYDFEGENRTVDTHVKQLRTKLGDYSDKLKTVHRVGYKFEIKD